MKVKRRNFIIKFFLGALGLLFLDAFWFEKYIVEWNQFDIADGDSDRIKVVQISDLHLRSLKSFHKTLADRINLENPDVVVITGDAITRNRHMSLLGSFLGLIHPTILKIAILGNKEYSGNVDLDLLNRTYIENNGVLLINDSYILQKNNRKINILGIDEYTLGDPNLPKSADAIDISHSTIILNHCPVYKEEIDRFCSEFKIKAPLILAGHTHGGQITFFGIAIYKPYGCGKYLRGWYNDAASKMYVSRGIGTTAIPIRFGARAEVAMFFV